MLWWCLTFGSLRLSAWLKQKSKRVFSCIQIKVEQAYRWVEKLGPWSSILLGLNISLFDLNGKNFVFCSNFFDAALAFILFQFVRSIELIQYFLTLTKFTFWYQRQVQVLKWKPDVFYLFWSTLFWRSLMFFSVRSY